MAAVFISSGAPSVAIGSVAWVWSGRVRVRRERARSMRLLYCRWIGDVAGGDGAALRRLAGDQDGVGGGGAREEQGAERKAERCQDRRVGGWA